MEFTTADLYDQHEHEVQVAEPVFRDYGGRRRFAGAIATVRTREDNSQVRATLEEAGRGRVLVVDGGGSMRCALVGDRLAQLALQNGWSGFVISGCIRDSDAIAGLDLGVKALGTHPRRSAKLGAGERNIPVTFAGVTFRPGEYIYADEDGILLARRKID
jgi:regulator of ribonuclease activity A